MTSNGINPIQLLPHELAKDLEAAESSPEAAVRPEARPVEQQVVVADEEGVNLTREDIEELTRVLNESAKLFDISLRFRVEEDINRIIVTVFDKGNDEVIRQIPPEEVVQMAKRLTEMVGVLFNGTA